MNVWNRICQSFSHLVSQLDLFKFYLFKKTFIKVFRWKQHNFSSSFIIAVIHPCCLQLTGLDLIKREEFAKLETLLQAEFQPLSRLLLLLGWMRCQSLDSAKILLRVLHNQQVSIQIQYMSVSTKSHPLCSLFWSRMTHQDNSFIFLVV